MREIEIHKELEHKNIIAFKEFFLEEGILIIIMEYCECNPVPIQMATFPSISASTRTTANL